MVLSPRHAIDGTDDNCAEKAFAFFLATESSGKIKFTKYFGNPCCKKKFHFYQISPFFEIQRMIWRTHNVISCPWKELSKRTHTTQKKNLFTYSKSKMGLLQVTSISASKYNLSSFPTMNDEGFICRHRSSLKLMPSKPKDDELEILANSISLKSSLSLQYPIPFFPSSLALTNHYVRKKAKMEDWQRIISLNQITIQGTMH